MENPMNKWMILVRNWVYNGTWQFFVPFLGWLSDLLERLSDLQLGDEKVTLNNLVYDIRVSTRGNDPIWLIFFKWVEATTKLGILPKTNSKSIENN